MALIITVPKNEPAGYCTINGQKCKYMYDLEEQIFQFKYESEPLESKWSTRDILDAQFDHENFMFICGDEDSGDIDIDIIQPKLTKQQIQQLEALDGWKEFCEEEDERP